MSNQEKESDVSTVSHDHLEVMISKKPHCQIKFDIKVKPKAVEAAYHKAVKNIKKEVNVPGFRKGRAPNTLILEKYHSAIQKEFVDLVLQTGFNDAIQLTHIHPLRDGHIKRPVVQECSREKGAEFTIEFEARPVIPSVQFQELKLQKEPSPVVTDKDRENALQNLLLQFATYDPIQDRTVQENDFVDLNVTILEEPPKEVVKNQRTQVNANGLPSWMREKVIGLKAGESAEGMTQQDLTLSDLDPNFQSLPFRVTVNAIWQGNLPAIDEALAQRVGLKSVEELYQKINERLEREIQEDAFKAEIEALEHLLVDKYPIDLPQSYIEANKQVRLEGYIDQMQQQNVSYSEEEFNQIEKRVEQTTIYHLQLFFLLRKVAADHQITVNNEDLSQELARQVALMPSNRSSIDFTGDKQQLQEQLHNLALDRKIKQFLIQQVHSSNQ